MFGNFLTSREQIETTKQVFIEEIAFDTSNLKDESEETAELQKRFFRPVTNPWGDAGKESGDIVNKAMGYRDLAAEFDEREPFGMDDLKKHVVDELKKSLGASERNRENLKSWIRSSLAMGKTVQELVDHAQQHDPSKALEIQEVAASMNL